MDIADDVKGSTADSSPAAQETKLVLRQASSCPSQTSDQPLDREIIDEAGDLLVQTSSKEFLVSSKILTLASPIFKAMFGSGFLEGNLDRSAQHPLELPLSDDSPDAWAVLFHILHFSSKRKFLMPDVDLHLEIAQLSDKYDCMASVQAESKQWLRSRSGTDYESSILWKLTTITFLLDHTEEFANFTAKLASTLSAAELDDATLATVLPGSLKGALHRLRIRVLCGMMGEVESTMDELRHDDQEFETGHKICTTCDRHKPPPTKKCHQCKNDEFRPVYCDGGSRVCEFFECLSSANIWPLSQQMEDSPTAFWSKSKSLKSRTNHTCDGFSRCPLSLATKALWKRLSEVMARSAGADLRSFKVDS